MRCVQAPVSADLIGYKQTSQHKIQISNGGIIMFGLTRRNQDMTTFNPWREMEEFEKAFFSNPFGSSFNTPALNQFRTDVTDEGNHYLLETDFPGFEKKDITLDIHDDMLTIRAERKSKVEEKDQKDKVIRMERSYGSYQRSFDISGVDADKIKAKYVDGVLRLTLPKLERPLPQGRRLEIE